MNVKSILIGLLLPIFIIGCNRAENEIKFSLGEASEIHLPKAYYLSARWAPDGEHIMFYYNSSETSDRVGIYSFSESKLQQVHIPFNLVNSAGWITNKEMYFTVLEGDGLIKSLYSFNLSESKPVLLKEHIRDFFSVDCNREGDEILLGLKGKSEIFKLDSEKNQLVALEEIPGLYPSRFSEQSNKVASFGDNLIKVFDRQSKRSATVVDFAPGWVKAISWSPDGKWIAFSGGPSKEISGIYIVDSEGKNKPIKIVDIGAGSLDWSPKGDQIVYTTVGSPGVNEVYLLKVPDEFK